MARISTGVGTGLGRKEEMTHMNQSVDCSAPFPTLNLPVFQSWKTNVYNSRISACRAPGQIPFRKTTHAFFGQQKRNHHHSWFLKHFHHSAPPAEEKWQVWALAAVEFFFFWVWGVNFLCWRQLHPMVPRDHYTMYTYMYTMKEVYHWT